MCPAGSGEVLAKEIGQSEAEAAAVIAERLVDLGVWDVRLGVADGLFSAEQAARRALAQDVLIVPAGESAAFLADLPIETLDATELVSLLRRMGITTLGAFARLATADVHTRFGSHGALLHRYTRGLDPHPISRRSVPPELTAALALEPPLELVDPIAFSLRTTAERFVTDLAAHGLVCTTVRIEVDSNSVLGSARSWMHPRWFGATDLIDRLRWQLAVGMPGPVDGVRLIPEVVEPLSDHADSLFGGAPDDRVVRGISRVQGMVGHEGVLSVGVQGGRAPADRTLTAPWGEQPAEVRPIERAWPGRIPAPAPATVFTRPAEALVVGGEGQPVVITGRGSVTCPPERFRPRPMCRGSRSRRGRGRGRSKNSGGTTWRVGVSPVFRSSVSTAAPGSWSSRTAAGSPKRDTTDGLVDPETSLAGTGASDVREVWLVRWGFQPQARQVRPSSRLSLRRTPCRTPSCTAIRRTASSTAPVSRARWSRRRSGSA